MDSKGLTPRRGITLAPMTAVSFAGTVTIITNRPSPAYFTDVSTPQGGGPSATPAATALLRPFLAALAASALTTPTFL